METQAVSPIPIAANNFLTIARTNGYSSYRLVGMEESSTGTRHESKTKFLNAALQVIRAKGYSATRIEDICEAASLTKGSFFHHFDSKEELALAAADYWTEGTSAFFASAPYHAPADPLDRLLAYVDFRKGLLMGELVDFTCLAGTMVQEVYDTHPAIRDACNRSISEHAATLVPDIEEAMRQRDMHTDWTAESLALYIQATLQGAFILAKAKHNREVAAATIDHLRRYLELLFNQPSNTRL
jgi:TetR/AcrR family transcriptional repressor of nem operon